MRRINIFCWVVNVNKTKSDTKIKIEVDENTSATQPACKRFKVEKLGTETSFLKTEIKKEIMEDDIRLYETQILEKSSSNVTNTGCPQKKSSLGK